MPKFTEIKGICRLIDANINRAKEGLRVCEDIIRFIAEDFRLTSEFKRIRHKANLVAKKLQDNSLLLKGRNSLTDVGRHIYGLELKRKNYQDIFSANIQRAKESIRALEEFSKLKNSKLAIEFKRIRYSLYEAEKKAIQKLIRSK